MIGIMQEIYDHDRQLSLVYHDERENANNEELKIALDHLIKEYTIRRLLIEEIFNKAGISLEVLRNGKK